MNDAMDKKLFLIDGHSLIFRMYYAFFRHPMVNSKGRDVSILFGFVKYLFELIEKEQPTHLAVCFDPPGKTFRHQMFPQYKGTRQAAPELVIEALEPLKELCGAMNIPVLMRSGFEGDDVLSAMAVRSAAEGMNVYMVTPDKDFGQIVSERIFQYIPAKSGAEAQIMGVKETCSKFGIQKPSQVIDILTICGDTADNVPGVDGIGEVGASKLISKWGSIENIYANLDSLTPRQKEQMLAAQDHISLSKALVTIKTDIPLDDVSQDDMLCRGRYKARLLELFDEYEFQSLKKYVTLEEGQTAPQAAPTASFKWQEIPAAEFLTAAASCSEISIVANSNGSGIFDRVEHLTLAATTAAGSDIVCYAAPQQLRPILENAAVSKSGYNLKLIINQLLGENITLAGTLFDISLLHYLLDPEKSHDIVILSRSYLNVNIEQRPDETPAQESIQPGLFDTPAPEEPRKENKSKAMEALAALKLRSCLCSQLAEAGMSDLYLKMEEPLLRVLSSMEREGVKVDIGCLNQSAEQLREEMAEIEDRIREISGVSDLNVSSPKQVGELLFEKLRIDPRMKPKKDVKYTYPTDEETLLGYADSNPIIYEILEFRAVKKLIGTYIEPFGGWVNPSTGRIHTTFNQALTATGRLSSSRPNLQNIPVRTQRGKEIRKAFTASSADKVIVSADYSQIELRLMAHFCGDENMREAFREEKDVHAITASKIFKVTPEEVTPDMRRVAKTANFGIMYGISAFGLAQRLRTSRVAAKKIIEDYFENFPLIQNWIEQTQANALRDGYVQTLFGRRRYLPEIGSRNATTRALAQRNAVNAPIQGTAADIIKIAMIRVDAAIRARGLSSRMVLQIHDELLFEAPSGEVPALVAILKQEMEHVLELSVPLTIECNYGKNWLEAH